jgi:hypothetical protein
MTRRVRDLGRFLGDGTRSLDDLLRVTASSPEALREISRERVARLQRERVADQRRVADALDRR